jgi:hypothetical protein
MAINVDKLDVANIELVNVGFGQLLAIFDKGLAFVKGHTLLR